MTESPGAELKEGAAVLKEMERSFSKILEQVKEIAREFQSANKAASSLAGSARDAHRGGAGGVGAGRRTAMAGSEGGITDTAADSGVASMSWQTAGQMARGGFSSFQTARAGGAGGAAALGAGTGGAMRAGGGAGALGLGLALEGLKVASTVQEMGRVSVDRAQELEWNRYRIERGGGDWARLQQNVNSRNVSLAGDTQEAMAQWAMMGLDRPGSGLNLEANLGMSRIMGQSAVQGLEALEYRNPNRIYQLQAMGVQVMNPDGSTRGEADVANQLWTAFYGQQNDITTNDLKQSFDPHIGAITQSLRGAGYSDTEIARVQGLFEEKLKQGGGNITDATITRATEALPELNVAQGDRAYAEQRRDLGHMDEVIQGASEALHNLAGTINNLVDNPLNEFSNRLGAANDVFKDAGFNSFASGVGALGVNAGSVGAGPPSEKSSAGPSRGRGSDATKPSNAEGSWRVDADQVSNVHQDEMILPARIAHAVRSELGVGQAGTHAGPKSGGGPTNVTINVTVARASDAEAVRFARSVKRVIEGDQELSNLGLGQVVM